jgi:UDP-N-acetylmuramate dehydrogenase
MRWLESLESSGELKREFDRPQKPHTSWGVGGRAEWFLFPSTDRAVAEIHRGSRGEGVPLHLFGGGTNLLVSDRGVSGFTVSLSRFDRFEVRRREDRVELLCEAGISLPRLLRRTMSLGLGGLEFCVGIPGTLGGALSGNAGAGGRGIGDAVRWIETIDPEGDLRRYEMREGERWPYRSSPFRNHLILRCGLALVEAEPQSIRRIAQGFAERRRGQPHRGRTAGCVFKNPLHDSAGRLLDLCGCKGMRIGGARVSDEHANFIVNDSDATAAEILALSRSCRERVAGAFGVQLDYEVRFLGEFE